MLNQDGRLLQERLTRAMIVAHLRMSGNTSQPSPEKILCIGSRRQGGVHRCEQVVQQAQAFVSNRFPSQVSSAPATTTVRITQRKNSRSSMKTNHQ